MSQFLINLLSRRTNGGGKRSWLKVEGIASKLRKLSYFFFDLSIGTIFQ